MTDQLRKIIDACAVKKPAHDNDPNCVRVHVPSLVEALRAALDAEPVNPLAPLEQFVARVTADNEPSPTNEELARDPIVEACQGCGHCDYDEAEGGVVAHCKACLVKISRAVHSRYYSQIAAAEARGLERAAEACESAIFFRDIEWWRGVTKQGAAREACLECAAAIRALKEE